MCIVCFFCLPPENIYIYIYVCVQKPHTYGLISDHIIPDQHFRAGLVATRGSKATICHHTQSWPQYAVTRKIGFDLSQHEKNGIDHNFNIVLSILNIKNQ